jgi:hypothetical protein
LFAVLLCGCLLFSLTACSSDWKQIVAEKAAESSSSSTSAETTDSSENTIPEENTADEEKDKAQEDDGNAEQDEENLAEEFDDSEDGEARVDITKDGALELIVSQFGTQDPDTGYNYEYTLDGADEIDGRAYYIYKQTWESDEEDAQAGAKILHYIFVATDGSVLYTGVKDGEESVIDYDTEIIP